MPSDGNIKERETQRRIALKYSRFQAQRISQLEVKLFSLHPLKKKKKKAKLIRWNINKDSRGSKTIEEQEISMN